MYQIDPRVPKPSAAFSRLMADHQGRLRAYIVSLVVTPQAADDVLQEMNVILCKKAEEFASGTNFQAWARRIAYLEVKRYRRGARRDRLVFDEDLLEEVEAEIADEDRHYGVRRRRLRQCLSKLGEAQRRMVLERYLGSRPVKEIAAERGCEPNAVSQLLFRARQALADCVTRLDKSEASESEADDV